MSGPFPFAGARLLSAAVPANCTAIDPVAEMSNGEIAGRIFFSLLLLALSALFSGLTLGLLSLDIGELELVMASGSPKEKKNAETILGVRRQGNLLLCVLLLGNASVNSLLSIVLADLTSGLAGFLISTFLILIVGEVLPQSACSRHALRIGAVFVPLVHVFIWLTYPLSKPLSMILDWALGAEVGLSYSRKEFKALLEMHVREGKMEPKEVAQMSSVLEFKSKRVRDVATPSERLFSVRADERLDYELIAKIYRSGFSRIPVWSPDERSIVGLLYAKDLMLLEPRTRTPVATVVTFFGRTHVNAVLEDDSLADVLHLFGSTHQHFAIVWTGTTTSTALPKVCGVVTLEDVTEALISEEISDEYDVFRPGQSAAKWRAQQQMQHMQAQLQQQIAARSSSSGTIGGGAVVTAAGTGMLVGDTFMGGQVLLTEEEREQRIDAAIRRLHAVTGSELDPIQLGRGTNNFLTPAEVAGLAAHLVSNTRAFRLTAITSNSSSSNSNAVTSNGSNAALLKKRKSLSALKIDNDAGAPSNPSASAANSRLDHDACLGELDRAFDLETAKSIILLSPVVDLLAPPPRLPRGAHYHHPAHRGHPRLSGSSSSSSSSSSADAQVDPTTFGDEYTGSILGGTVAAAAAARTEAYLSMKPGSEDAAKAPRRAKAAGSKLKQPPLTSASSTYFGSSASLADFEGVDSADEDGDEGDESPFSNDNDEAEEDLESKRWLVKRGDLLGACLVILEGEVEVVCGEDGIACVKGSFDVLGEPALLKSEGSYRADFSLRALSPVVRALRIDRKLYDLAKLQAARRNRAILDDVVGVASNSNMSSRNASFAGGSGLSSAAISARSDAGDGGSASGRAWSPPSLYLVPSGSSMSSSISGRAPYRHSAPTVPDLVEDLRNAADFRAAVDDSSNPSRDASARGEDVSDLTGVDSSSVVSTSSSSASSVHQWLAERGTVSMPPSPFSATADKVFPNMPPKYTQHDSRRSPVLAALPTDRKGSSFGVEDATVVQMGQISISTPATTTGSSVTARPTATELFAHESAGHDAGAQDTKGLLQHGNW